MFLSLNGGPECILICQNGNYICMININVRT